MLFRSKITAFQGYLRDLVTQGRALRATGLTAEQAATQVDLTAYATWFPQIQGRGADLRGVRRLYQWMDEQARPTAR